MSAELEARAVHGRTLTWNGIPVLVTGCIETHPVNWELISNSTQAGAIAFGERPLSDEQKLFLRKYLVSAGILRDDQ